MRYLSILVALLFLSFNARSQERVDKQLPVISATAKGVLKSATGWLYNPEGKWVSKPNRIPANLSYESRMLMDYERYGLGLDNFIQYELRTITIEGKTYDLLIKTENTGRYDYPHIRRGWRPLKAWHAYIIDPKDLEVLKTLQPDSSYFLDIPVIQCNFETSLTSLTGYMLGISKQVNQFWGKEKYAELHIGLNIWYSEKRNLCRFFTVRYSSQDEDKTIESVNLYYGEGMVELNESNMKRLYFETTLANFRLLFSGLGKDR